MRSSIAIICNYLTDSICADRYLYTRNAASSKKLLSLAKCLGHSTKFEPYIFSLGCGQSSFLHYFRSNCSIDSNTNVHFIPFFNFPLLKSPFSSLFLLIAVLSRRKKFDAFYFYNYLPHYIPLIFTLWLLRRNIILEVDDSFCFSFDSFFASPLVFVYNFILEYVIDYLSGYKKLVAANSNILHSKHYFNSSMLFYYVFDDSKPYKSPSVDHKINVLLSGTLDKNSGLQYFIDSLEYLRTSDCSLSTPLHFHIWLLHRFILIYFRP